MFTDQDWQTEKARNVDLTVGQKPYAAPRSHKKMIIFIAGVSILLFSALAYYLFINLPAPPVNIDIAVIDGNQASTTPPNISGKLPEELGLDQDNLMLGSSTINVKAEDLTFGILYEKLDDNFLASIDNYALPINVKTDVANYYDIARKFDLDPYIESLNKNGFALADNEYAKEANDFFSVYRHMINKDMPIVVTSDFLLYYFQNSLKQIYKEIEKNAFYDTIWDLNNKLFLIALTKYRQKLDESGITNDPVLEGQRAELAYLAVGLKLLQPVDEQINHRENFSDEKRYTREEAEKYSVDIPAFLREDVEKEVTLVREGRYERKSPVFLYQTNYANYQIPDNYKINAKLNNFYLAIKWLNSVFPLYYKSENCPSCLLDKNDWIINFAAAMNITDDLYKNQEIKNQWAVIYKFISYFSGLRRELTFLDYRKALVNLYGENYKLEEIFSSADGERDKRLDSLRDKIAEQNFLGMEGGLDRNDPATISRLGMRFLQERYWPDDYIFSELTGQEMRYKAELPDKTRNITYCNDEKNKLIYRCRGTGLDVVNLLYPVSGQNKYFAENINYLNYPGVLNRLKNEIDKFDIFTWNNNIYWSTLDISRLLFGARNTGRPDYMASEEWGQHKAINTVLGAWTTLRLVEDTWVNYYEQNDNNLGIFLECNKFNFIEPDLPFGQELVAKNNMLIKMLTLLKVVDKTNIASIQLKEFNKKLMDVISIIKKELNSETLDNDDCRYITDLVGHYEVERRASKEFSIPFPGGRSVTEKVEGVKILIMVSKFGDKKIMLLGPVFNYEETAR